MIHLTLALPLRLAHLHCVRAQVSRTIVAGSAICQANRECRCYEERRSGGEAIPVLEVGSHLSNSLFKFLNVSQAWILPISVENGAKSLVQPVGRSSSQNLICVPFSTALRT